MATNIHGKLPEKKKASHPNQIRLTAEERNKTLLCNRSVLEKIVIANKESVRDRINKDYLPSKFQRFELLKCLSKLPLVKDIRCQLVDNRCSAILGIKEYFKVELRPFNEKCGLIGRSLRTAGMRHDFERSLTPQI